MVLDKKDDRPSVSTKKGYLEPILIVAWTETTREKDWERTMQQYWSILEDENQQKAFAQVHWAVYREGDRIMEDNIRPKKYEDGRVMEMLKKWIKSHGKECVKLEVPQTQDSFKLLTLYIRQIDNKV